MTTYWLPLRSHYQLLSFDRRNVIGLISLCDGDSTHFGSGSRRDEYL